MALFLLSPIIINLFISDAENYDFAQLRFSDFQRAEVTATTKVTRNK